MTDTMSQESEFEVQRCRFGKSAQWPQRLLSTVVRISTTVLITTAMLWGSAARADVTWGGWLGANFNANSKSGSKPGFDIHPWYFYLQAEPVEDLRVFGEIEAEHLFKFEGGKEVEGVGEIKIERLYVEKTFGTSHNLRLGKTFTPFGYWYRLHWNILTETVSRPFSMENAYVPRAQVGLQYWGRKYFGDTELAYYAWLTNGPDIVGTGSRSVAEPGLGASVFVTHSIGGRDDLSIGGTAGYHLQWVPGAEKDTTVRQQNAVVGLEAKLIRVDLRGELYWHHKSLGTYRNTVYGTGVGWLLPQLAVTYRFDWGDDAKGTKGGTSEKAISHSFGLMWKPDPSVVARIEGRLNNFQDSELASFWSGTASVAVKF